MSGCEEAGAGMDGGRYGGLPGATTAPEDQNLPSRGLLPLALPCSALLFTNS